MLDKVTPETYRHPHPLTEIQREHVLEHYQRAAPVMALDFPHVPIVAAWHDDGLGTPATFQGAALFSPFPRCVDVRWPSGLGCAPRRAPRVYRPRALENVPGVGGHFKCTT